MEIKETLFKKSFSTEHENPYALAISFMKSLSETYRVYEKKNEFATDGPVKKTTLIFDLVEPLDDFSQIRVNFSLLGENEVLYVDIIGYFMLRVKDEGYFTEAFTEFYLNNIFPVMRKASEEKIKQLDGEFKRL